MTKQTDHRLIRVYADWTGIPEPMLMGLLHATRLRGKEIFAFEYDPAWLQSEHVLILDPDLQLYSGRQFLPDEKSNFGVFLDSSPDRWGRVLMDRREAVLARAAGQKPKKLFETDYLLGVYDGHRMGALRFKAHEDGPFLNSDRDMPTPPWTSIRELEEASLRLEEDDEDDSLKMKWLNLLLAPGSSLGGARPKASVVDERGQLWIAKFPSRNDAKDIGGWEKVVFELAKNAGVSIAEARSDTYSSKHHTYLTKRFDRNEQGERTHFASAMTLLGHTDGTDYHRGVSYLDLAEFIVMYGAQPQEDLEELWRRIVFYICVSNTDDHLRNHGFLLTEHGWRLSPAYDVNPVETGTGLSLNISQQDNSLDLDLAREVAPFFRVSQEKSEHIIETIRASVKQWNAVAANVGISTRERDQMASAFTVSEP